jgi:MFS superfamily sulfate permease-like transporter
MKLMNKSKQALPFSSTWKSDLTSGFGVSLIALPLCLAIATASGFPPISGIITAIVGGLFASRFSGSYITIYGPAAGLIVVNLHAVNMLGGVEYALAAIAVSGIFISLLGLFKVGKLSDFFPSSVVKGMLAAIGIIIIVKQLFIALGVSIKSSSILDSILQIPSAFNNADFFIGVISGISFLILIVHPILKKIKIIKVIPAPIWVLLAAIILGNIIQLPAEVFIKIPNDLIGSIQFPDFSKINSYSFLMAVASIALITSLESLLSTSSMDSSDPLKRKSNLNKDLSAIGIGSSIASAIGGLPMIAEIVRSTANISLGGKTQWSNFFHAIFLLLFVLVGSSIINQIPIAALAVMLIMVGYKLASPKQFVAIYKMGYLEFTTFISTIIGVLLTDLLIGILIGILVELLLHYLKGFPISKTFTSQYTISEETDHVQLNIKGGVIFSNYYLSLKKQIVALSSHSNLVIDFTNVSYLSESAWTKINDLTHQTYRGDRKIKIMNINHLLKYKI